MLDRFLKAKELRNLYRERRNSFPVTESRPFTRQTNSAVLIQVLGEALFKFPVEENYAFALRKNPDDISSWDVDVFLTEANEAPNLIGSFTLHHFENDSIPSISFSNKVIEAMIMEGKGIGEVEYLIENPHADEHAKIKKFLEMYDATNASLNKFYEKQVNNSHTRSEKTTVDRLLNELSRNPASQYVTSFNPAQLTGGQSINYWVILGYVVGLLLCLALAGGSFYGSVLANDLLEILGKGLYFVLGLFGAAGGVVAAIFSLAGLGVYISNSSKQQDAAKLVGELLQEANELTKDEKALKIYRQTIVHGVTNTSNETPKVDESAALSSFKSKHSTAKENVTAMYKKYANNPRLQAEFHNVMDWLDKMLRDPRSEDVTSFEVNKLLGGVSFFDQFKYWVIPSILIVVCIGILTGGIVGLTQMADAMSPLIAPSILSIVFGFASIVGTPIVTSIASSFFPKNTEAAEVVSELLEEVKKPEVIEALSVNNNFASLGVTEKSDQSYTYATVFSKSESQYKWEVVTGGLVSICAVGTAKT